MLFIVNGRIALLMLGTYTLQAERDVQITKELDLNLIYASRLKNYEVKSLMMAERITYIFF